MVSSGKPNNPPPLSGRASTPKPGISTTSNYSTREVEGLLCIQTVDYAYRRLILHTERIGQRSAGVVKFNGTRFSF